MRRTIEKDLPAIISQLTKAAKDGNIQAAKLLIDRCVPTIKPIQQSVEVRGIADKSLSQQGELIVCAMGDGLLSPEQAQAMLTGLANLAKIKEADEIEQRLSALEEKANKQ